MTLLNVAADVAVDIASNVIPYNIVTLLVAFSASFAVIQFKVKDTREDMKALEKKVDNNKKDVDDKFDDEQRRREELRKELVDRVHDIDKKVTEIHTILTQK